MIDGEYETIVSKVRAPTCGGLFMTDRGRKVMSPAELEVRRMSDRSSRRESETDRHGQTDRQT